MSEIRELVCINCPMGCRLTATIENGEVVSVTGNTCKRGADYAKTECVRPVRTVTALAQIKGTGRPVSARTAAPVPKETMMQCAREIAAVAVEAPVHIGDVILENVAGTGVDVIATSNAV